MSFCTHCGSPLNDEMLFCPKCGHKNLAINAKEEAASNVKKKKSKKGLFTLLTVLIAVAVIGFMTFSFAPKEVPFSDDPESIAQAASSVVKLNCFDSSGELIATGSGFVMFEDGVIITNYHVIADGVYSITGQREDGLSFEVDNVLAYNEEKDIAILKTNAKTNMIVLAQGDSTIITKGENVVAIGSPLGLLNSVSEGVFSGFIAEDDLTFIQFTAAISHGSSGGPLFDDCGNVIGITCGSFEEGQNLNLAVPIEDVLDLWNRRSRDVMTVTEFYDSFDHTPPIPTYTVGYVLEHYRELDGQMFYMRGYLSSYIVANAMFLVDSKEDTKDIPREKSYHGTDWARKYLFDEIDRRNKFICVAVFLPEDFDKNLLIPIRPKDYLEVLCQLEIVETYDDGSKRPGAGKLEFISYEITVIES